MAWVLTDILNTRILKAYKNKTITSVKVVFAKPIKARQMAFTIKAIVIGMRLSNWVTNQPDKGSPIKELTGMVRRTEPNSASLRPKDALMVGIRDAQLEKLTPDKKKNKLRETRCALNDCIMVI